jgi:hypothetical protein
MPPQTEQPATKPRILPGRKLLELSFSYYKTHLKTLLGIWSVPVVFSLLSLPFAFGSLTVYAIGAYILIGLISWFLFIWAYTAMLWYLTRPLGEQVTFASSYKAGFRSILSVLWIWFLSGTVVYGAFFAALLISAVVFGGLLFASYALTIPQGSLLAIIFSVILWIVLLLVFTTVSIYISQAMYVLFAEEKKGLSALAQSWIYVKGKGGAVMWRLIVLGCVLALILLPIVIAAILIGHDLSNQATLQPSSPAQIIVNALATIVGDFIFMPLACIYGVYLYLSIKETSTPPVDPFASVTKKRRMLLTLSILGIIAVGLIILALVAGISILAASLGSLKMLPTGILPS